MASAIRNLLDLTWLEIKIFVREPMGVIGSLVIPVAVFLVLGKVFEAEGASQGAPFNLAVLAALIIAISAVLSLVAVISIYREGGILKRLRATPLGPLTILGAHVLVKLLFTAVSLGLLVLAGRQFFPGIVQGKLFAFLAALLLSTLSILSVGFVIASLVPTARFAQPLASALLYPMLAVSGLFFPLDALPVGWRILARLLPTTHAASLLESVWNGQGWPLGSLVGLASVFAVACLISARVFRWE